jgi:hypothetical protein
METIPEFPELRNLAHQMTENWKPIPDWEPDWKKMRGSGPAPEFKSPVEVCVHGLTAKFFLDLPDDRIIPSYNLKKAERTGMFCLSQDVLTEEVTDRCVFSHCPAYTLVLSQC